jgi:hypothetical protein
LDTLERKKTSAQDKTTNQKTDGQAGQSAVRPGRMLVTKTVSKGAISPLSLRLQAGRELTAQLTRNLAATRHAAATCNNQTSAVICACSRRYAHRQVLHLPDNSQVDRGG